MALLFIDSFDHYATADILEKWTSGSGTIGATGRRGSNGVSNASDLAKGLTSSGTVFLCGVAVKPGGLNAVFMDCGNAGLTAAGHVGLYMAADGAIIATRGLFTELGRSDPGVLSVGAWAYVEYKLLIDNTVGTVEVRVDGIPVLALTGQDTQTGASAIWTIFSLNGVHAFDDLYVCDGSGGVNDDFLGDLRVDVHLPNGAGSTTGWTPSAGNNYACADDATPNDDTDYVSTDTVDAIDTYEFTDLANAGGAIQGLQVLVSCKKEDVGACSIAPVVRPAATDRLGTTVAVGTSYAYHARQCYDVSPETGIAWTEDEFNGSEFGVKKIV